MNTAFYVEDHVEPKNGEAQTVIVDEDKRLILKFSNKEVDLAPDDAMAYKNRAQAFEKMGDKAKAQADRDKVAELEKQQG